MRATVALIMAALAAADDDTSNLLQTRASYKSQSSCDGKEDKNERQCRRALQRDPNKCKRAGFRDKCEKSCCDASQPVCPANEFLNPCGNHCEGDCDNANPPCTKICGSPACQCNKGLVRLEDGQCGEPHKCTSEEPPLACGEHEVVNPCGSRCEEDCGNEFKPCPMICDPPACVCEKGYVRGPGGQCITRDTCPQDPDPPLTCGANEVVNSCGSRCEGKCGNKNVICPMICDPPACVCDKGYLRSLDGKCVREDMCSQDPDPPPTCGENEVVNPCGSRCEGKCGNKNVICPMICDPPACVCDEGYLRSLDGKCIKEETCPLSCSETEEVGNCGNLCESKCGNLNPACPKICAPEACKCRDGFARHKDGHCVPHDKCPA